MSIRFDNTSTYISAGYSTGKISIFNLKDNKILSNKLTDYPITSLTWKPNSKTILLLVSSNGLITQLHSLSGKSLYQFSEKDNQIMCADYSAEGNFFATCGDDKTVRLYDDETKMEVTNFPTTKNTLPDITNRLYSLRFSPSESNLIVAGGWDSTIHFFDIRQKTRVNYIYGPHICGDGIDIKENLILTTAWSGENQAMLWDIRLLKVYMRINVTMNNERKETNLYSGRFNKKKNTFAITGANADIIRVYSYNDSHLNSIIECGCDQLEHPCYCVDFNSIGDQMIYSGYDSIIRLVNVASKNKR